MESKLCLVKADGTYTNTGCNRGAIRYLELFTQRPFQWDICLLHLNESPLRHIFTVLDGTAKSPHKFSGPIGSTLNGLVTQWEEANFKPISFSSFPFLPNDASNDLSTDQYYGYHMCWTFKNGKVDEDLDHLEIGPLNHSRWITFACRILRFYVSQFNPTKNLCLITEFAIKVYFRSWFDIKANTKFTDGSKNLYNMIVRINCLSVKKNQRYLLQCSEQQQFFAHGENIHVSMLGDSDEFARRKAVNIIMKLRENCEQVSEGESTEEVNNNVDVSDEMIESFSNMSQYPPMDKSERVFKKPIINF